MHANGNGSIVINVPENDGRICCALEMYELRTGRSLKPRGTDPGINGRVVVSDALPERRATSPLPLRRLHRRVICALHPSSCRTLEFPHATEFHLLVICVSVLAMHETNFSNVLSPAVVSSSPRKVTRKFWTDVILIL